MVDANDDNDGGDQNAADENEFVDAHDLLEEDGFLSLVEPSFTDKVEGENALEQSLVDEESDSQQHGQKRNHPPPWIDSVSNSRSDSNFLDDRNNKSNVHRLTLLHNEIVSFVQLIEPLPSEIEQRELLVRRIRETVKQNFPDGTRVEVFGSQATGLFLPTSDIDLVVLSPNFEKGQQSTNTTGTNDVTLSTPDGEKRSRNERRKEQRKRAKDVVSKADEKGENLVDNKHLEDGDDEEEVGFTVATKSSLHRFAEAIRKDWLVGELSYLEIIENTRIPLVKFTDASTNISVDVSFDQPSGPPAAQLMKRYLEALPPLRPLTFVLKYFLAARCLNEPYSGGVGSFLLQLMIVAFLQHRERDAVNFQRLGVYNLGSLLLEFLELYGIEFNYFTTGISVRYDGFFFPKGSADRRSTFWKQDRMSMMAMENPLEPTLDVGQSSFRYQTVQRSFAVAYKTLLAYISAGRNDEELLSVPSILVTILPPTEYMTSRKVLKRRDQSLATKRPGESSPTTSHKRSKK